MKTTKKFWEERCKKTWDGSKTVLKLINKYRVKEHWPYVRCPRCKEIMISFPYFDLMKEEIITYYSFENENGICWVCQEKED